MAGLSLEVGQTLDEAWAERACALPPPAREQLLAQADSLREREGGVDTAFACYRALRADLDPAQATHAERVAWLLGHVRAPDPALEALARTAAGAEPGSDLWFFGQFRMAFYDRAGGRVGEAVRRLLVLRGHTAGRETGAEGAVLANLTMCLLQQERSVEALLIGRRAIVAQARTNKLDSLLHVKLIVARAYARFQDWDRYEELLSSVEASLADLTPAGHAFLEPQYEFERAMASLERRRFDEAVARFERYETTFPERAAAATARRAYALALSGRVEHAAPLVAQLTAGPAYHWRALWLETVETLCSIARDPRDAAAERVARFLEHFANPDFDTPGRRARQLMDVAAALQGRDSIAHLAKPAYDIAATCMLARMVELDRFTREEKPLAFTREERAELGRLRETLLERHQELRRAVARHVRDMPADWFTADGLIALCAWCGRVRLRDGTWVPLGGFLPKDESAHVTHGMCPDCRGDYAGGSS